MCSIDDFGLTGKEGLKGLFVNPFRPMDNIKTHKRLIENDFLGFDNQKEAGEQQAAATAVNNKNALVAARAGSPATLGFNTRTN